MMTFGLKTLPYNGTEKIEDPNNQSKRFGGNVGKKIPFIGTKPLAEPGSGVPPSAVTGWG